MYEVEIKYTGSIILQVDADNKAKAENKANTDFLKLIVNDAEKIVDEIEKYEVADVWKI